MASTYRRFVIPIKTAVSGGGRCLCELLPNGCMRVTLAVKGLPRRALNLWIFDDAKAVVYPKTLYPNNAGTLELRGNMPSCGLEKVCGAALTDEAMQQQAAGFTGNAVDWQAMLQRGSMAAEEKDKEKDKKEEPQINAEEVKHRVKGLVKELDESLHGEEQKSGEWRKITPKDVAENKRLWKYAKNPFLTAEFNKFGHLLYCEDEKFCRLGVPCLPEERFAGAAQGFRIFDVIDGNNYAVLKCEK